MKTSWTMHIASFLHCSMYFKVIREKHEDSLYGRDNLKLSVFLLRVSTVKGKIKCFSTQGFHREGCTHKYVNCFFYRDFSL